MADRKRKSAPAGITVDAKAQAAMTAEVNRSVDEWRAMNNLPPVDRSKKERANG